MFDIVAKADVVIDSLASKVSTLGNQRVLLYTKQGSHIGSEDLQSDWTLYGSFDIQVVDTMDYDMIGPLNLELTAMDTLGFYLHLDNPSSNLVYDRTANATLYSSSALEVISSTGKSYNFGDSYFPSAWNGEVFYHFGYNPLGRCTTGKIPVQTTVNDYTDILGPDTTINQTDILTLDIGSTW